MTVQRFRKVPVVISALEFTGDNYDEVSKFIGQETMTVDDCQLMINTLEGNMLCNPGDFIIEGVAGEFYPCKPDIFKATYELIAGACQADLTLHVKRD